MAGFEEVIQRAIEKQQPASATVREQVYNSARATLANMLAKAGNLSPENILQQQQNLETAIASIELSHRPPEPQLTDAVAPPDASHEETASGSSLKTKPMIFWRRPFAMLLFGTIILAAIGISAWWVYDQKLTMPAEMRDNSVPNPPKILADESSADADQGSSDWLTVFDPKDPTGLISPSASTAVLGQDESGQFIRLKTTKGELQRSFQLVIEPGIFEETIDKTAVFEITAKSSDSDNQQFVITCQFGSSGDCGRQNFVTEQSPKTFKFEKDFSTSVSNGSTKSGTISILVDLSGQGLPLDLYSIRVRAR